MPADTFRLLILPDCHVPYHDPKAWACALAVARGAHPDGCVQLGDFGSFDSVSRYKHDPRLVLPLEEEVAGCNASLDELDLALKTGGCARGNRWFLEGNHERRIDDYILDRAPEARFAVDWRDMLHLDRRGWQTRPYKESLVFGEARISHDFGRAGVNAARATLLDVGQNTIFGHTHRLQVMYQGTQAGKRHVGATLGWLGDMEKITYRHRDLLRRDSQLGFGWAHFLASGEFWLQAVPIVGGRCIVDGVVYSA